jgi:hypothetical protein
MTPTEKLAEIITQMRDETGQNTELGQNTRFQLFEIELSKILSELQRQTRADSRE